MSGVEATTDNHLSTNTLLLRLDVLLVLLLRQEFLQLREAQSQCCATNDDVAHTSEGSDSLILHNQPVEDS